MYGRAKGTPNPREHFHEVLPGLLQTRRSFYIEVELSPRIGEVEAYVGSQ